MNLFYYISVFAVINFFILHCHCLSPNFTQEFTECISDPRKNTPITCSLIPDTPPRSNLDFKCISKETVRIIGNYTTLTLRCLSSTAITFDYDGMQPTEAFRVIFWKKVVPKTNRTQFTYAMDVVISSNAALREKYRDPTESTKNRVFNEMEDNRTYSRSGKYIIRGIWEPNVTKSLYFFIEENSKITFLENSQTRFATQVSPTMFLVPCRPSHYDAKIRLMNQKNEELASSDSTNPDYSPERGFIVDWSALWDGNATISCQLESGTKQRVDIRTQDKSSPPLLYGFESELLQKNKSESKTIEISIADPDPRAQQWYHSLSCRFIDSLNIELEDPLELQVIETDNPAHTRLLREFVMPKFANRSHALRKGYRHQEESIIENLNTHVIAYCANKVKYRLAEHGTALNYKKPLLKEYTFDWVNLRRRTAPDDLYIDIKTSQEHRSDVSGVFYVNNNYTFVCQTLRFTQAATLIWYTTRKNGSRVEEKIIDKISGSSSLWTTRMASDISKIHCTTSLWYDDNWKFADLEVNVQEGSSPYIGNIAVDQVVRVSKTNMNINQVLDCLSTGRPAPNVYWRKNGITLHSSTLKEGNFSARAIFKLSEIASKDLFGEYECVASNFKDEAVAKIRVEPQHEVWDSSTYFLVIGLPLIVFLCTALAGWVYLRYFRKPSIGLTRQEIQAFRLGTTLTLSDGSAKYDYVDNINKQPYNKNYEVTRKNFVVYLNEVLGTGAYGMVCKGTVSGTDVAVKTLNALAGKQYLKALLSELKVMLYLGRHDNIVQLVGAYTELLGKGKIYVFMELCALGNLEGYLRKYQRDLKDSNVLAYVNSREAVEMEECDIIKQLDEWAYHIATGLSHLNEKKVIHGDLAARNVLLSGNKVAKITDFGLSRRLYDYADYVKKQQEPLPWRWMAIESLQSLSFSVESDIWSFGILLWEIYSLGDVPYPGMSWNAEFLSNLKQGMRMCRPDLASQTLYTKVILECWRINPKERPTPAKMATFFKSRPDGIIV